MSANWTDDAKTTSSPAASSDGGRNHTLHEAPLCRWCFIQRVLEKKKRKRAAEWEMLATAIYQRGSCFSLWIAQVWPLRSEEPSLSYFMDLQIYLFFVVVSSCRHLGSLSTQKAEKAHFPTNIPMKSLPIHRPGHFVIADFIQLEFSQLVLPGSMKSAPQNPHYFGNRQSDVKYVLLRKAS